MPSEPLTAPPATLVLGDSLRMRFEPDGFTPADWSLEFALVGPTSTTLSVSVDGEGWIVTLPLESDDLAVGLYSWAVRMFSIEGDERKTIASGQMAITADPQGETTVPPTDERTWARRALEACEAAILRRADATSFSVFGRSYTFPSPLDLLEYRARLRSLVDGEEEQGAIDRGEPSRRTAWVRF